MRKKEDFIQASGYMFSRRYIHRLLLPLIAEQLLSYLVGLADSVMVASAGEAAVSAVSLVDSISVLMVHIFSALAAGGAIVVGQYLGRREQEHAKDAADQLMAALLALSLLVTAALIILQGPLLRLLFGRSPAEVQENCRIYYRIVMLSIPMIAVYNGGAALFRAVGDSRTSMRISLLMNVINVCGNALLVYAMHMGVAGVAIATLVSRTVAMLVIVCKAFRSSFALSLRGLRHYRPHAAILQRILSMGIPNGIENGMFQLGKLVMFSVVSTLPTASIAANAIANTITSLHWVVGTSTNLGLTSVVSPCVGAGDYKQARWYIRYFLRFIYLVQSLTCGSTLLAIPLILKLYHVSAETAHLATIIMLIHGVSTILLWPLAFSISTGMRAAGDVRYVMVVSSVSMWLCRVGLGSALILVFHTGVVGLWITWVVDWLFRISFFVPHYLGKKWETKAIPR